MTFDSQISTTGRQALADARDKISGMAGWGVVDDSVDAGGRNGGYVVFSTPEDVDVGMSNSLASGNAEHQWSSSDHNDPGNPAAIREGMNWDPSNSSFETSGARARAVSAQHDHTGPESNWSPDDTCEYWLHYSEKGFYFYVRRTQGDGNDSAFGVGYQQWETEYWDFHSAKTTSGYAAQGSVGATGNEGYTQSNAKELTRSYGGDGLLNPDSNFSNYVYDDEIYRFDPAVNNDTNSRVKAATTPGLWKNDKSGTSLNAGDVIQGSGGTNEFMVLDYHNARIAISMQ